MRRQLTVLVSLFCACFAAASTAHADTVIGVFSDNGSSCSFSGNNTGLVTAHVVVRPDGGVRGVRFKAPIPDCFDAVYVTETVPEGVLSIGDSQTGISLAFQNCANEPAHVLDITYYASGGTTPCCELTLAADPLVGYLQAVDCNQVEIPMQSLTAYMNADSTCQCSAPPIPPGPPSLVYPPDGATSLVRPVVVTWACANPNALDMTCDLYVGTTATPPLLAAALPGTSVWSYSLQGLLPDTQYYWRAVSRNPDGGEASGPVWSFRTRGNDIPVVTLTSPADGATGVLLPVLLKWTGTDSSPLVYDVYFGTDPLALPAVVTGIASTQYSPPSLAFLTKYYWRVVGRDPDGGEGATPTRSFTTRPENLPPNAPFSPSPANNATNVSPSPIMAWAASDPDGQALTFDVYLGTNNTPPLVASNVRIPYQPNLLYQTKYYWRVVARDTGGLTTSGSLWNFTTRSNTPPSAPSNPSPANNAVAQPLNSILSWTCVDVDGHALAYDVYFGNTSPPPLVSSNQATASYDPGPQNYTTLFYWRVVARDPYGAEAAGPVWIYTTRSEDESPVFASALPADGAINVPTNATLQWSFIDPDGEPLNYDVYFGTDTSPPLVADHISATTFAPGTLLTGTYYRWRVVARDPAGHEASMAVRTFITTTISGGAPFAPSNPSPPNNGPSYSLTPLLTWQGGDPDGDLLHYEVYMTQGGAPLVYLGSTTSTSFQVQEPLVPGAIYQWYVTAYDDRWYTQGPLWSFTATYAVVPVAFASFGAVQNGTAVDVRWTLGGDEALQSYTLYRRDSRAQPAEIARGRVDRASDSYRDTTVQPGTTYTYELVVRSSDGNEFRSPVATVSMAALELALHQNVPNPFNPQTTIRYELPQEAHVRLLVFDVSGRLIRTLEDRDRAVGTHEVTWTGRDDSGQPVTSGVYFYVLEAGKQRLTKKLVLLK
ncbi:MAG TPA: FlgD immunoglobulin-like domain containing protein [Candidatus Krumholzibacteria bacterium]